jgi:hypothetical protein
MNKVLIQMLEIYKPELWDNHCWMDYKLTKDSPYTFHHIVEARNGGKKIISNGAILTLNAHRYLNFLDNRHHNIYKELNCLFYDLNRTYAPPTQEYYEEVRHVLKKVRKLG